MNLSQMILPKLWDAIRHHYETASWSSVMLDAVNALGDELRAKSGLQGDGTNLVGQALGGKSPRVKLNKLVTESDQNVQAGIESIARGLYQAIRNPRSHGRVPDTESDAAAVVIFVNYLLQQLGQARDAFTIDAFLESLRDRNFVPSQRYAALLLADVPKSKLGDTVSVAFAQRPSNCEPLREFFTVGIGLLEPVDRADFFELVTSHVKAAQSDGDLRTIFQSLAPVFWKEIGEVARLRAEHWIAKSLRDGLFDASTRKFQAGTLATWARTFFPNFTLKAEIANAIVAGVASSNRNSRSYALQHFLYEIDEVVDAPPHRLISVIKKQLSEGSQETHDAVRSLLMWHQDDAWTEAFEKAVDAFVAKPQPRADFSDDDIPF